MEGIDFVHLAWHILYEHGTRDEETGQVSETYEDDFIEIDTSGLKDKNAMYISRKPVDDPERPHLRVSNPVTIVSACGEDTPPEVIRHHGEHIHIVPHMMYLIETSEKFAEFYIEMLQKYPDITVHQGI